MMKKLLTVVFILCTLYAQHVFAAPALVQKNIKSNAGGTISCSVNLTSTTAGNSLILSVMWNSGTTTSTVTSTPAQTWLNDSGIVNPANRRMQVYHVDNITGGNATASITFTGSVANSCLIHEVSGLDTTNSFDKVATSTGSSVALDSGLAATTTVASEYIFGSGEGGTDAAPWIASGDYTLRATSTNPNPGLMSEDRIVSQTGSYKATSTAAASTNWGMVITTYKQATPASAPNLGIARTMLKNMRIANSTIFR